MKNFKTLLLVSIGLQSTTVAATVPLTIVAAILVDAVTRALCWLRFYFRYLRTLFMYSVTAATTKPLLTPTPPVKNIWKDLGGFYYSSQLICNAMHIAFWNGTDAADSHSTLDTFHETVH